MFYFQLVDESSNEAAVVDPVNASKVIELVQQQNVRLTTVLTTHHHWYFSTCFILQFYS